MSSYIRGFVFEYKSKHLTVVPHSHIGTGHYTIEYLIIILIITLGYTKELNANIKSRHKWAKEN